MTRNRKIKRLEKQNQALRQQNQALRNKIPAEEYANKMNRSLERFENINDDLTDLYHQLCRNRLQHKNIYLKYQLGILWIRLKQRFRR